MFADLQKQLALRCLLEGKVLRRARNESDSDYAGGGWYDERKLALFLFADGTFRWEKSSFSVVRGGGMSLPSRRSETREGTWQVMVRDGAGELVLTADGAEFARWPTRDGGPGVQILDGQEWNRYLIRD
jgi:hypothetical protein